MDGGHLVGARNLEGHCVNPEDPWRLVVHATRPIELPAGVHERGDRAVDGLVAVEQAVEEGGQVGDDDRDGDQHRPQSEPDWRHLDLTIS
jgi:hypothetical protein